jgi:hypothetical protein
MQIIKVKYKKKHNNNKNYYFYLDQKELEQRIQDISQSCRSQVPDKCKIQIFVC